MIAGTASPQATRAAVERALRGRRLDVRGVLFEAGLLLTLLLTMAVLLVLLGDVTRRGLPVIAERGLDFFRNGNSLAASRAGVFQAVTGSLLLMAFVVLLAFPIGI